MQGLIRKALREDCEIIPKIETIVRNETYKNIVEEKYLNELYLTEKNRIDELLNSFDEKNNHRFVLEINHNVVGFVNVGKSKRYNNCGEIFTLYILKEYTNKGFGKKLINEGINELKSMGYSKIIVGCFEGNNANEFYKHLGGKIIAKSFLELFNIYENFYLFENI